MMADYEEPVRMNRSTIRVEYRVRAESTDAAESAVVEALEEEVLDDVDGVASVSAQATVACHDGAETPTRYTVEASTTLTGRNPRSTC